MILRLDMIAHHLRLGKKPDTSDPLVITPEPDIDKLQEGGSAAIDLRLGTWFVTLRRARFPHLPIGEKLPEAQLTKYQYVPFGTDYFLHPHSFVLGATLEWVRLPKWIAGYVIGKSSWGRRGLIIATATGVHPGFTGCLTLELSNVGEIPIPIQPGMPICQLFLHMVRGTKSGNVEQSQFGGLRRPTLGKIELDDFAKKLAAANKISPPEPPIS